MSNQTAELLRQDLINTKIPMRDLAEKYNITLKIVRHVNHGETFVDKNLSYPLRQGHDERCSLSDDEQIHLIKWLLKNSNCSMEIIGSQFNSDRKVIARINNGHTHFDENESYSLRKKRQRSTDSIIDKIKQYKEGFNE